MKSYTVFFESFGKKYKADVNARTEDEARLEILKKVKFIRFEAKEKSDEDTMYDFITEFLK
jgi:hypothetical protein